MTVRKGPLAEHVWWRANNPPDFWAVKESMKPHLVAFPMRDPQDGIALDRLMRIHDAALDAGSRMFNVVPNHWVGFDDLDEAVLFMLTYA